MANLREIRKLLNINHEFDQDLEVDHVRSIDDYETFSKNTLSWVSPRRINTLSKVERGVIVCPIMDVPRLNKNVVLLMTEKPRLAFTKVLQEFFTQVEKIGISERSFIHDSVELGENCTIGHNVVIEEGSKLGSNCTIGHNTVIKRSTVVNNNVIIGSNCTIGGVGFGYEQNEFGNYIHVPHLGNVKIENNVEIGNNVCIDRAVLGSTVLQKDVKVDNLVHIAHGVNIGKNSLIIANSMVAGSVSIGANSWVAPSSSILNKITIGDNVTVGMAAVVLKDVENNDVVVGIPAKSIRKK